MSVNYARSAQTGFAALRAEYALAAVRAEVPPPPPPSERQRLLGAASAPPPAGVAAAGLATSGVAPQATAALVEAVTADLEIAVERAMTPTGREAVTALLGRIGGLPRALAGRPPAAALALLDPLAAQFETLVETTTAEGFAYRAEAEALAARTEQATWMAIGLAMLAALAVTLVRRPGDRAGDPPCRPRRRGGGGGPAGHRDPAAAPRLAQRDGGAAARPGGDAGGDFAPTAPASPPWRRSARRRRPRRMAPRSRRWKPWPARSRRRRTARWRGSGRRWTASSPMRTA